MYACYVKEALKIPTKKVRGCKVVFCNGQCIVLDASTPSNGDKWELT